MKTPPTEFVFGFMDSSWSDYGPYVGIVTKKMWDEDGYLMEERGFICVDMSKFSD